MPVRSRSAVLAAFTAMFLGLSMLLPGSASAGTDGRGGAYRPGAPGVGDEYFPLDGNGGYDVRHYLLEIKYDPATDELVGRARLRAHATHDLLRFNLD